ncbi:MAG: twin-arginine translocase subunit TatC [Chloroflexi bacterium]|nr:twin-arginine translocase subunit TatC [Chloroflexota bacterium]
MALVSGFILAMPFILYQFWLLSPGLTKNERRYVYLFIPATLGMFLLGILFCLVCAGAGGRDLSILVHA